LLHPLKLHGRRRYGPEKLSAQSLSVSNLTLPHRHDRPAGAAEVAGCHPIPGEVRLKLALPEFDARLWRVGESAVLMPMPETPVHQYDRPVARQHNVRLSGQRFTGRFSESEPQRVQD
jgi:hypothetical protein